MPPRFLRARSTGSYSERVAQRRSTDCERTIGFQVSGNAAELHELHAVRYMMVLRLGLSQSLRYAWASAFSTSPAARDWSHALPARKWDPRVG
jgi:hypothetical protein